MEAMTLRVIKGGKPEAPEHRKDNMTLEERASFDVIERVCAVIHNVDGDEVPGYPAWQQFVDAAYENSETNPRMLQQVSDTIRIARAAIAALRPEEPSFDEDIALLVSNSVEAGGDAVIVTAHVTAWIDQVLK